MKLRLKSVVYTWMILIAISLFITYEAWAIRNDYFHLAAAPAYLVLLATLYSIVEYHVKEGEEEKENEMKYHTLPWTESEIKFHQEEIVDKKRKPAEYAEELIKRFKSEDYTMTFINQRISYIKMYRGADWYSEKYPADDLLESQVFWQDMKEYMNKMYNAPKVKEAKTLKEVNKILNKA